MSDNPPLPIIAPGVDVFGDPLIGVAQPAFRAPTADEVSHADFAAPAPTTTPSGAVIHEFPEAVAQALGVDS